MLKSLKSYKTVCKTALTARLKSLKWNSYKKTCQIINQGLEIMPCSDLIYATYISHRHKYVYINNPKTGGSSLKSALVQFESKEVNSSLDYYNWEVYQNKSLIPLSSLNDLRNPTNFKTLIIQDYKFITFVRNPYSRLLSCYRDKILRKRAEKSKVLQLLGHDPNDITTPIGFDEFINAIVAQKDHDMDHHWRTQTSQILYDFLPYDLIGRFENYQEDFYEAFRIIGLNEDDTPEIRHLNSSKTGANEGCRDYYTPDLQRIVFNRYRADFENFHYPQDLPK